ncbi:DNA primase [Selenomonas sp. TAMA-11512]|uniref:DNA primase n=1 Tax=Selenomonas sp. TAMA-11512 TaxID=3095337 RepID=UPI003090250F|nr:DNA primase [Selenomonas sp. TAMA-11512]
MAFRDPAVENFVNRVKEATEILPVVSNYVQMKRRGNRYWGCCPFHQEDTPSFSVVPEQGFFYCFGCHTGGDAFKFISLIENVSYFEAVKLQAEKLNIPMPERERSEAEKARDKKMADLYRLQQMARDFFHNCLTKTNYGKPALAYLERRGIGLDVIEKVRMGYAPPAWDKLVTAFQKRGVTKEILLESGLAKEAREKSRVYDAFRDRVIIPIADVQGRVVAFGGRILGEGTPKYLNSPETPVFNKRRLLFGLDRAHRAIAREGRAVIVEGYMDAISVAAHGIENVVASLGTAFTIEQCRLLLRYAPELCFCYDSDEAGQAATLRALSIAGETGASLKVLKVPDGKDPDEFIRKHGAEAFQKLVDDAVPMIQYRIDYILERTDYNSLQGRLDALKEILPVLRELANAALRNTLIPQIAQALTLNEGDIRAELDKTPAVVPSRAGSEHVAQRTAARGADEAVLQAGRILLRGAWLRVEARSRILETLSADAFSSEEQRSIYDFFRAHAAEENLTVMTAEEQLSSEAAAELSRALAEDRAEEEEREAFADALRMLRKEYLEREYRMHIRRADELEKKGDEGFLQELAEIRRIKTEMDAL